MTQSSALDFYHQRQWSEEFLTYLSVTDYQDFVPIPYAVTGHKDVITKKFSLNASSRNLRWDQEQGARERGSHVRCWWRSRSRSRNKTHQWNLSTQWERTSREASSSNTYESRQLSRVCSASLIIRRSQHHGSSRHEDIKFRLRCSCWNRNLEADGSHTCWICSSSDSHSSQANHDTHREESRKINQRPSNVSSLAQTDQQVRVNQLWKDRLKHQDHVSTSKCPWTSCRSSSLNINEKSTWNETHNLLIN